MIIAPNDPSNSLRGPVIIRHPWPNPTPSLPKIFLSIDRSTLAKRRWHAVASDGADFGFDLDAHLHDGDVIFETDTDQYVLAQNPEPILEVPLSDPAQTARTAWSLGNLHFPIAISAGTIQVADDPAVRIYLERAQLTYTSATKVFHPITSVPHGHSH